MKLFFTEKLFIWGCTPFSRLKQQLFCCAEIKIRFDAGFFFTLSICDVYEFEPKMHLLLSTYPFPWNDGSYIMHEYSYWAIFFISFLMFMEYIGAIRYSVTIFRKSGLKMEFFAGYTRVTGHFVGIYLTNFICVGI